MAHIVIVGGPPYCPLCDKRMKEVFFNHRHFYVCTGTDCMISISRNDPCIEKWKTVDPVPCQFCKKPMKMFFRKDKFIKMQCWDKSHHPYQVMRGDAQAMGPV